VLAAGLAGQQEPDDERAVLLEEEHVLGLLVVHISTKDPEGRLVVTGVVRRRRVRATATRGGFLHEPSDVIVEEGQRLLDLVAHGFRDTVVQDEDDALDLLDAAVDAALVHNVGPDRYTFAHALVGRTLYEGLSPSRRGRVHRRIAVSLEERPGGDDAAALLAHHWASALVPDDALKAGDSVLWATKVKAAQDKVRQAQAAIESAAAVTTTTTTTTGPAAPPTTVPATTVAPPAPSTASSPPRQAPP